MPNDVRSVCDWGEVRVVSASMADILDIYSRIRAYDKEEVAELGHELSIASIKAVYGEADIRLACMVNGKPEAFIGVKNDHSILGAGRIYALMTDEAEKHKMAIGIVSKRCIMLLKQFYSKLYNIKACDRERDIKWLKSLGFKAYDGGRTTNNGKKILYLELITE